MKLFDFLAKVEPSQNISIILADSETYVAQTNAQMILESFADAKFRHSSIKSIRHFDDVNPIMEIRISTNEEEYPTLINLHNILEVLPESMVIRICAIEGDASTLIEDYKRVHCVSVNCADIMNYVPVNESIYIMSYENDWEPGVPVFSIDVKMPEEDSE